jgi:selenide,water dikinase
VLGALSVPSDPRVLVDYRTADDAGVYRLDDTRALVQTVDFFTPIVDDAWTYGRIAAANALSDVYAMGGRPLTALAIAGFPRDAEPSLLGEIFRGGLEVLQAAHVALLGGHTVQDAEIKFGYAVTGEIDPERIWTNAGAQAGDRLILTKPIGTGVIGTAIKFERAPADAVDAAIESMTTLNRAAADALASLPRSVVHACTDITGFGVIGHATEMANASGCSIEIAVDAVPLLPRALDLVERNTPGGGRTNREHFSGAVATDYGGDTRREQLLFDPQTSGGLLASIAPSAVAEAIAALSASGAGAWIVGEVTVRGTQALRLR